MKKRQVRETPSNKKKIENFCWVFLLCFILSLFISLLKNFNVAFGVYIWVCVSEILKETKEKIN